MSFQNGDPIGGSIPPSIIGQEFGEFTGALPSSLKFRQFYQQTQPTLANSMGMHSLPPVSVRTPISDQYALGIARPDLSTNVPDPTVFKSVNGNVGLGGSVEGRREAQLNFRSKLQANRRAHARVIDG